MNEEEKLKRITEFLEKGCTMLATHHDCGAPLFRCKGRILCPVCSSGSAESDNTQIGPEMPGAPEDLRTKVSNKIDDGGGGAPESSVECTQPRYQEQSENNHLGSTRAVLGSERSSDRSETSQLEIELAMTKQSVGIAVLSRLRDLASNIKDETDLGKLRSELDCVEAAIRVIGALKL